MKCDGNEPCSRVRPYLPQSPGTHSHTIFFHSVLIGSATAYTSKADEEALVTPEPNGRCRMRISPSNGGVPVTKASCLMSSGTGNVSSTSYVRVLLKVNAEGFNLAHLSSLSKPGSGLLHLDEDMAMINPGCCSLPTQPTSMNPPAAQSMYPNPQSFSFPDSGFEGIDCPIRTYESDSLLCETLDHAQSILPTTKS